MSARSYGSFEKLKVILCFPGIYSQPTNAACEAVGLKTEHRRHLKLEKWEENCPVTALKMWGSGPPGPPLDSRLVVQQAW